jgi:excisionase family DNA binding protein
MTTTTPVRRDDLPHLLSIADLAEHLGVDIRHVRRLVSERRIPFIKWGHLLRFDPAEIDAWINEWRHHPGAPRVP